MNSKRTRPETTLLLSLSIDGRITSHDSDFFDPDPHWKNDPRTQAVLSQFYDFNQPGLTALTTGVFMKSLGINTREGTPRKENLNLVILDPDADLTPQGISYLSQNVNKLYLACLNSHPYITSTPEVGAAFTSGVNENGTKIIQYPTEIDLYHLFKTLHQKHQIKSLLIHSIAPLNATLLDAGLIDHLSIIISPIMVGSHGIPALLDKENITIRSLSLKSLQSFSDNYINLQYDVNL